MSRGLAETEPEVAANQAAGGRSGRWRWQASRRRNVKWATWNRLCRCMNGRARMRHVVSTTN